MANNDLNQIRIFTKVAQLRSFTKAADILEIEKSTVSSKISQLETRLGIRLLQRTTRSVNLTEAGSQYLVYCEQALSELQMGDDFIAGLSHVPSGHLRVNAPHNLVDVILPTVITPFLEAYPKVNLEIVQSNERVDLINDNFDIAICATSGEIKDSSLIYRKIYHSEWTLVASQKHIDQYGIAKSPLELAKQPSVGMTSEASVAQNGSELVWQGQKVTLKHRFAVNNMNSIKLALKAGLGFAIVPKKMIRHELNQKELIELSPEFDIKPTSLYVVYPTRSGQPAKVRAFVDALVQWGGLQAN